MPQTVHLEREPPGGVPGLDASIHKGQGRDMDDFMAVSIATLTGLVMALYLGYNKN